MNELIVKRIKDARIERGLTQKDLADHLGRTAAAISDLERGKVQISASDLYKLAVFLGKPVEYFYGINYSGKEIEDVIALIREIDPETDGELFPTISLFMEYQLEIKRAQGTKNSDNILEDDAVRKVYNNLISYLLSLRALLVDGIATKSRLEELLKLNEDEIPTIEY